MDWDALKGLGTLLLWGGFFFLMMRIGCGAHMMGGHANHGSHGEVGETKDPVCGMKVDQSSAASASGHGGKTYYFCSITCRDKFEKEPEKYTTQVAAGQKYSHGGCHG
jgi:YHS domain-containing protein